jgi:hypothetical protein
MTNNKEIGVIITAALIVMISTTIIAENVEARFCATPNSPIGQVADKLIKLQQGMLLLQPNNQTIKHGIANLTSILCKPGETTNLFGNQSANSVATNMTTPKTTGNIATSQIQNNIRSQMTSVNMTKYTDPQGRFSISYPDGWNVQPVTNRFQTVLVTFANYPPTRFDFLSLAVQSQNTNEIASTDPLVVLNNTSPPSFDWSLFQSIECAKYTVDGNKACSLIWTHSEANLTGGPSIGYVGLLVASYVNHQMYSFLVLGRQDTFDSQLSIIDSMIKSFKTPA